MHINCDKLVETYLLNKNPLYTFSFPIGLIISIIVFGYASSNKWSNNSYILQILIPILTLVLVMVAIDMISRMMISVKEKDRLIKLCNLWMHNPNVKNNPILNKIQQADIDLISVYNGHIEGFENVDENTQRNSEIAVNPLASKDNSIKEKDELMDNTNEVFTSSTGKTNMCIENSNACSLCSGSGSNPYNVVAPIPGPQWLPQTAAYVQERLKNNDYTKATCSPK